MRKLGFGLMRLPLQNPEDPKSIDLEQLMKMTDDFLAEGFTYFDTAYMYHEFQSEIAIREALVKRHPRDHFTLTTKLPTMFLKTEEDMERIFQEQMEKCGVEFFDYYLLHNLGVSHYAIAQKLDCFGFIQKKKAEGKIRKIGFSYHDNAELLDEILTAHPETEVVQLQLNYLDWEDKGIQSRKCYEVARKHEKEIIVMEPVKGGTLVNLPEQAERLLKDYAPDQSLASWAIRFAAGHDGILTVLSGMSNLEQLRDNMSYMKHFTPLCAQEKDVLRNVVSVIHDAIAIPCTGCNYCTGGCPKQTRIPEYFALYNAEMRAPSKGFSLQRAYYENYAQTAGQASDCIACGQCERQCPQHIGIIKCLQDVAAALE